MRPSQNHSNRRRHNWLIYRLRDRHLERLAPLFRGDLVDLGCGEAPFRSFLEQHGARYTGVDWPNSPHRTRPEVEADLNEPLPLATASADTVLSISVLEHLKRPTVMLAEAHRILRPGGQLVLQTPWQWMVHEAPFDYFRYSPFALEHLLTEAGFVDISIEPEGGFWAMWALKLCYFLERATRGRGPLRRLARLAVRPVWFGVQALALWLDRFDREPTLEAASYYTTARRP